MHPVDRRRDHDAGQRRFEPRRQLQIGMVEDRRGEQQRLEQQHRVEREGEQQDHRRPRHRRQQHLAEMEAQRRGSVERPVEMVHEVEAPEEGHLVIGAVPPVDQQVEQDQVGGEAGRAAPPGRAPGERAGRRGHGEGRHHQRRQAAVDQPADYFLNLCNGDRINPRKRLIEQQKKRRKHESARDFHAAPLATRKRKRLMRRQMIDPEHLHQCLSALLLFRAIQIQGLQDRP